MGKEESYEIRKIIKNTEDTKVYLVRHRELHVDRIMKKVRVNSKEGWRTAESGPSGEAQLLARLKHPGIPVLYDSYREDSYLVWIEEYIQGESLSRYMVRHSMTEAEIVHVMCALTEILNYLHRREPKILYQDLKPEHIYLKGSRVILIDYGIAGTLRKGMVANGFSDRYGSPEQKSGQSVDEKTDLYSLGRVAETMAESSRERISMRTKSLIRRALKENPDRRPEDMCAYGDSWFQLGKRMEDVRGSKEYGCHLLRSIAIMGAERSVGCTHLSIALTVLMNHNGIKTWFDNPYEGVAERILESEAAFDETEGIIYHDCMIARPHYGPGIAEYEPPEGIRIIDCGVNDCVDADIRVCVCSSSPWKMMRDQVDYENFDLMIVNPGNREVGRDLAYRYKIPVIGFPADEDALSVTKEKRIFYKAFMEVIGD